MLAALINSKIFNSLIQFLFSEFSNMHVTVGQEVTAPCSHFRNLNWQKWCRLPESLLVLSLSQLARSREKQVASSGGAYDGPDLELALCDFCSFSVGWNSVTWPHSVARASGNCSSTVCPGRRESILVCYLWPKYLISTDFFESFSRSLLCNINSPIKCFL